MEPLLHSLPVIDSGTSDHACPLFPGILVELPPSAAMWMLPPLHTVALQRAACLGVWSMTFLKDLPD